MILPLGGKNQNGSSIGWEEQKWFFPGPGRTKMVLPSVGKNQKWFFLWKTKWFFHGVGRTKMVLRWGGKSQNSCFCNWEESKTILPGTNQDDFSYAGKNHKILQSKMERHKWFFRINGKNQKWFFLERTNMILSLGGKNQNGSSKWWEEPKWFFHGMGRIKMVLPRDGKNQRTKEPKMILPIQGRTIMILQSKMEQHKWFFSTIGKNKKWFFLGITKMILPWVRKNQNDSSLGWEEPKRKKMTIVVLLCFRKKKLGSSMQFGKIK